MLCESYLYFSSIDVRTSFFLLALYSFTCDVPNTHSIGLLHTCIKKMILIFKGHTNRSGYVILLADKKMRCIVEGGTARVFHFHTHIY